MKNVKLGKLIFGFVLLIFGVIFLLINFNIVTDLTAFEFMSNFWAFGIIISGLLFLFKQRLVASIVLILSIVFGLIFFLVPNADYSSERKVEVKTINFNDSIKQAEYNFNYGAGEINIKKGSENYLLKLETNTTSNEFVKWRSELDENGKYEVSLEKDRDFYFWTFFNNEFKSVWNVEIHDDVDSILNMDFGAAKVNVDLRDLKVSQMNMDFGASDVIIYFDEDIDVDIDNGASKFNMYFPKDKNIEVRIDGGALNINMGDFKKNGKYYYYGDETNPEIIVRIDSGASEINGRFYNDTN